MVGFGYGHGFGLAAALLGSSAPPPPVAAYELPYPTEVRLEPSLAAPTADVDGRATLVPDMQGLANGVPITGGTVPPGGTPKVVTDVLGRTGLLFEGTQALAIENALANYTANDCTAYAIVRYLDPAVSNPQSVFGVGRNGGGAPNTLRTHISAYGRWAANGIAANSTPPFPSHGGRYLCDSAGTYGTERVADASLRKMILHSGLQVVACAGAGASGTAEVHHNDEYVTGLAAIQNGTVAASGGEIGRHAFSAVASSYGTFVLYGLFVTRSKQTTAQIQANIAAMMAAYKIGSIEHQIVLEGDSRFADSGAAGAGESKLGYLAPAMSDALMQRGLRNYRVINHAIGGSLIDADVGATTFNIDKGLRNRRDYQNQSLFSGKWDLPGRNVVAVETWYNDDGQTSSPTYTAATYTAARADEIYANLIGLVSTDARSYLSLGWEYVASISMPGSNTKEPSLLQMRGHLRSASFFTDMSAGPGQTYAGKVRRAEVPLCMPIAGSWGAYVLGPSLPSNDARIRSNGGIYYDDQAHQLSICAPYIAACLLDRIQGADPYV